MADRHYRVRVHVVEVIGALRELVRAVHLDVELSLPEATFRIELGRGGGEEGSGGDCGA